MEIAEMCNFDPLATGFRNRDIAWLGSKESARVGGDSEWTRAEISAQEVANVVAVRAGHISQGENLRPDGAKIFCVVVFVAAGV